MKPRSMAFDLFGDYIRYRGGEVRMRHLTAILGALGVADSSVRVVMARLRKEGWFDTRREGRETVYLLNDRTWRLLDEGRARIFDRERRAWNGQWHMVIYSVPEADRAMREILRKDLAWFGFGPLASSTWVSPHDLLWKVEERFADRPNLRLDFLHCRSKGVARDRDMAARCWDFDALNAEYQQFLQHYRPRMETFRAQRMAPAEALAERMTLTHDYRQFPFRDPDLPLELLPAGWLGRDAHELFLEAHKQLGTRADEFVDSTLT